MVSSGENQESKEDSITSFAQSQFEDDQPFKQTSPTVARESDTSTRVTAPSETSSNDVISDVIIGVDAKPGDKPGTSQYKCSDRPGVLRMKLSKENWQRLAENGTNQKEVIETKSSKEFLVDETPEKRNNPVSSSSSEEMVTGRSLRDETGYDVTQMNQSGKSSNQSGKTSLMYKSYLSEKNLKETKKEDRSHLSGKHKSRRHEKSRSGENFCTLKNVFKTQILA